MKNRILAVDDDKVMLEFIRGALTGAGYDVTCVTGGQDAIDILAQQIFDAIVLDYYMPGKDGLDVVASMYSRKDRTPTIVFTTSKIEPHHEAGVQGFGIVKAVLKKPCTVEKLTEVVKSVLVGAE